MNDPVEIKAFMVFFSFILFMVVFVALVYVFVKTLRNRKTTNPDTTVLRKSDLERKWAAGYNV